MHCQVHPLTYFFYKVFSALNLPLFQWFVFMGNVCSLGDVWQCLEAFLVSQLGAEGFLLISGR